MRLLLGHRSVSRLVHGCEDDRRSIFETPILEDGDHGGSDESSSDDDDPDGHDHLDQGKAGP